MSLMSPTSRDNLTLTATDLAACRPVAGEGGQVIRAWCPFHESDHQRSLRLTITTGRFVCFACGAWGYTEEAREQWQAARQRRPASVSRGQRQSPQQGERCQPRRPRSPVALSRPAPPTSATPSVPDLVAPLKAFQDALPGSRGAAYLHQRGIPLAVAQQVGVGYAAPGAWPHATRDWRGGRLVVPHTDPAGQVVNLYGRAIGTEATVPKSLRHDHLPGAKGYFNAGVLQAGSAPLLVCEGAFDALTLLTAGCTRVVAIFGVHGWRWGWVRAVPALVLALDADATGNQRSRELARHAVLRGKQVSLLPAEAYGGYKDLNAAWVAGAFTGPSGLDMRHGARQASPALQDAWEERAAIMEWEGGLSRAEADQRAARAILA